MSQICVKYGVYGKYVDVTDIVLSKCVTDGMLVIPALDTERAAIFGDPLVGILKHIVITKDGKSESYFNNDFIFISTLDNGEVPPNSRIWYDPNVVDPAARLATIHSNIRLVGGDIRDEYPEQLMAVTFIERDNKVLEIGSNIGRNTLTIATILAEQNNLVTLESDPSTCRILEQNMRQNRYQFNIEPSALSYRKLIQKGWDTIPSEVVLPGYTPVNTITFQELEEKYKIQFDTLVADCEGALYYILADYPDMLNNINTVIMENDYTDIKHKLLVDAVLISKGFKRVYVRGGGWGPCTANFFETWKK